MASDNSTHDPITDDDEILEGEEGLDNSSEESVYPNAKVRVSKDQYSILHLKRLVEERKSVALAPDFQRLDVWNTRDKSELVESILMGIPLPIIYLFEAKDGSKQVVDGKQRISAVIDFLNGKFKLSGLRILKEFNGRYFSELPPLMQGIFEDYQMSYYIIQPPTAERVKYDIFDRVNRGGVKLNNQEMRNALYRGTSTEIVDDICASPEFRDATGGSVSPKRMRDKYVVLRTFSFYLYFSLRLGCDEDGRKIEYRSDMEDFLAKTMCKINRDTDAGCKMEWCSRMKNAFAEIHRLLGEDAFRFESETEKKRPVNMPLVETLTYLFMLEWHRPDDDTVRREVNALKREFDKSGLFRSRVDSSESIRTRFERVSSLADKLADS